MLWHRVLYLCGYVDPPKKYNVKLKLTAIVYKNSNFIFILPMKIWKKPAKVIYILAEIALLATETEKVQELSDFL